MCLDLRSVTFQRSFEPFVFHFLPGLDWIGCTIWTDGLIKVHSQLQKHSKITTRKTVKNTYSKNYKLQYLLLQAPHNESEEEKKLLLCKQRKPSFAKLSFCRSCCQLGRNTYDVHGKSANAQFGKTQFFETPCIICSYVSIHVSLFVILCVNKTELYFVDSTNILCRMIFFMVYVFGGFPLV